MSTPRKLILLAIFLIGFVLGTLTAAYIHDVFASAQVTHEEHLLNTYIEDGWRPVTRVITEPENVNAKPEDWPLLSEFPLCMVDSRTYTDVYKNTVTIGTFSGEAPCN